MSRPIHSMWQSGTAAERGAYTTTGLGVPFHWWETDNALHYWWNGSAWVTGVLGTGTANYIAYWSGASVLASRASFSDDGSTVTINRNNAVALLVEQSGVNDNTLIVDTTNARVGVNTAPQYDLDVLSPGDCSMRLYTVTANSRAQFFFGNTSRTWAFLNGTTGNFSIRDMTYYYDAITIEPNVPHNTLYLKATTGNIGINLSAPAAQLHIDQASTTAAKPVLTLDQADVSEEFIRCIGTAAASVLTQSIVDEGDQASETREGWLKVYVQDDGNQITNQAYYIPIYSLSA